MRVASLWLGIPGCSYTAVYWMTLFSVLKYNLNGEIRVPKHNASVDDCSCWSHLTVLAALTQDLWEDLCPAGAAAASQMGCSEQLQ